MKDNHIFLSFSSIINEICKPLKKIGINYVTYLKSFKDGSHINLSNSAEWIDHYYKFKLYESSLFHIYTDKHQSGFYLWPVESGLEVFKHGRNYFDSDNGITVIEKSENHNEFFFFSGSRQDVWLANLYINNLDVLEKFILHFKDKLQEILREAEKSRIYMPDYSNSLTLDETDIINFPANELSELKQQFLVKQNLCKIESNVNEANTNRKMIALLSERENDIIACLLSGKTAKETAKKLFISPRTVEAHLNNIKIKLNCRNKFDLVNKVLNDNNVCA